MKSKAILEIIETGLEPPVVMSFETDNWRNKIPSSPGWYFIETDTPPEIFKNVGSPVGQQHYDIPKKVLESLTLKNYDACILPTDNPFYFIYSGEAKNLKARAREHYSGHEKTGCLALKRYPLLHKYEWNFHYSLCPFVNDPNDNKLVRIFGEQLWRAKYGWPILCGK